jgi:hypothetical protein
MKINKTESSFSSPKPLSRVVSALVTVLALGVGLPAFAQQGYESPPVLSASKILPPELWSGPNFQVRESVTNDGYLNTYTVDYKFGTLTAVSTALLRKRIGEINAMVVMEKVQSSKEYVDSIKQAGLDTMTSALSLVTSPVQTLSGAAQGLGAAFSRVDESLFGGGPSQSEDSRIYETGVCLSIRSRCLFGQPKASRHVESDLVGGLRRLAHMVRSPGRSAGRRGYRHECDWDQPSPE